MTQQAIGSYNTNLPTDILEGPGVLMAQVLGVHRVLGATRGGITFDPGKDNRQVPYDGQKAGVTGLDRAVYFKSTLKGTLIQLYERDFPIIEPGGTISGSTGAQKTTPLAAGIMLTQGQYVKGLHGVWSHPAVGFVHINFAYALIVKYTVKGVDKAEAEIAFEFEARRDPAVGAEGDAPYTIFSSASQLS